MTSLVPGQRFVSFTEHIVAFEIDFFQLESSTHEDRCNPVPCAEPEKALPREGDKLVEVKTVCSIEEAEPVGDGAL